MLEESRTTPISSVLGLTGDELPPADSECVGAVRTARAIARPIGGG